MAWLVVLGNGSWSPAPGVKFKAGKHEVTDDDIIVQARAAMQKRYPLLLSEVEPEIIRDEDAVRDGKPLSADQVRYPRKRGVAVKVEEATVPGVEPPPPSANMADEFPCDLCPDSFPSPASLETHIEWEHMADGADVAQEPEGDVAGAAPATEDLGKLASFVKPPDDLGKLASFVQPSGEPIPWPEDDGPAHIPMPRTGGEETVILDGAPPVERP